MTVRKVSEAEEERRSEKDAVSSGAQVSRLDPKKPRYTRLYHFWMNTWPGGLLTCLLGELPARFSSESGRGEFILPFPLKIANRGFFFDWKPNIFAI